MKTSQLAVMAGLLALLSGCATEPPRLVYWPNTEPFTVWVYPRGSPSKSTEYIRQLTKAELKSGKAEIPELVFEKPGFKKYYFSPGSVQLTPEVLRKLRNGHCLKNPEKVILEKDPSFEGIDGTNWIKLIVNSEPQGGRVYENGKFVGTTPCTLWYQIFKYNYSSGSFRPTPLVVVHDECLPERQDLDLKVDPDWRYESSAIHEYATLFLLKRDPNYKPPVIIQGQSPSSSQVNLNVQKDKDVLDVLQQAGQIGIMLKSLQPTR